MVMLSFIARRLYKRPLPDTDETPISSNNVAQVCVISSNRISTIGSIMATSENNNNDALVNDKNKQDIETIKVRF